LELGENKMNDKELEKIWQRLDSRITTINERTKAQTLEIREIRKILTELQGGIS